MNRAVEIFSAVPKIYNCAQSVAAAFGEDALTAELRDCGGGRAPEGRCGALHAALQLIPGSSRTAAAAEFVAAAGSERCRELKGMTPPFPCAECVRIAAELVEKYR